MKQLLKFIFLNLINCVKSVGDGIVNMLGLQNVANGEMVKNFFLTSYKNLNNKLLILLIVLIIIIILNNIFDFNYICIIDEICYMHDNSNEEEEFFNFYECDYDTMTYDKFEETENLKEETSEVKKIYKNEEVEIFELYECDYDTTTYDKFEETENLKEETSEVKKIYKNEEVTIKDEKKPFIPYDYETQEEEEDRLRKNRMFIIIWFIAGIYLPFADQPLYNYKDWFNAGCWLMLKILLKI